MQGSLFPKQLNDLQVCHIFNGISHYFAADAHSQLCGVPTDGLYQACDFKELFCQSLGLNDDIVLPITSDAAHLLNVTDV